MPGESPMKNSTAMKHSYKAGCGGKCGGAKVKGAKCGGVSVVSGVVQGPVNSPEPGAKRGGRMSYAKKGRGY